MKVKKTISILLVISIVFTCFPPTAVFAISDEIRLFDFEIVYRRRDFQSNL